MLITCQGPKLSHKIERDGESHCLCTEVAAFAGAASRGQAFKDAKIRMSSQRHRFPVLDALPSLVDNCPPVFLI